ncbi:hypothetical protein PWT90_05169 [Aphanocladium album]|nr:hypothetical protein PWT90_05169 [Aphanocladium album]
MDEYIFEKALMQPRNLDERTASLEILNYSGEYAPPPDLPDDVSVQQDVRQTDTFAPAVITLSKPAYEAMFRTMQLPTKHIETSAVVGPFFWYAYNRHTEDPCLQIIFRKSDVRKRGKTHGFEMVVSYSFKTNITSGYIKGTTGSEVNAVLKQLRDCTAHAAHPMMLPVMYLRHDLSERNDIRQRDMRGWLRSIEAHLSHHGNGAGETPETVQYSHTLGEIDGIARDLTECYSGVLWRRPALYSSVIDRMQEALRLFAKLEKLTQDDREYLTQPNTGETFSENNLQQLHDELLSRLEFLRAKLLCLEYYREDTLERLKLQRDTLANIITQRDARLNIEMAKIAHAGKRDSTAMKIISLMGVLFLPGSYLASIFSMTFFNFQNTGRTVSSNVWIYVVITVPVTAALVAGWVWFERRRRVQQAKDDADFEKSLARLENDIVKVIQEKSAMRAERQTPWSYS